MNKLRRAARRCEEVLAQAHGMDRMLLRLDTAAAALDTPRETLRSWFRTGRLARVRIGRNIYVERAELLAFIERHRNAPTTGTAGGRLP